MNNTDDGPKMMTVHWKLSIGFPGANIKDNFEIEAEASDDEIDEYVQELAQNHIEVSWSRETA